MPGREGQAMEECTAWVDWLAVMAQSITVIVELPIRQ